MQNTKKIKRIFSKKVTALLLTVFVVSQLMIGFPQKANATDPFFSDSFTSNASNWTPSSGAWVAEDGAYKHKAIGTNYALTSSANLLTDDFATGDPALTNDGAPFTEDFTNANAWSVKVGEFGISEGQYVATGAGATALSIPSDPHSWSDLRITATFTKAGGATDAGYAMIYFRTTMGVGVNANKDTGYALLFRQVGVAGSGVGKMDLYARSNGSFGAQLGAGISVPTPNDNNPMSVVVTVVGTTLKIWINKTEAESPSYVYVGAITGGPAAGTVGVGTMTWNSSFDSISVQPLTTVTARWSQKRGNRYVIGGRLYTQNGQNEAATPAPAVVQPYSIWNNPASLLWKNYKISASIKNTGGAETYNAIYFRTTMEGAGTTARGYGLVFNQSGTVNLYTVTDGAFVQPPLGTFTVTENTEEHDIIIKVYGATVEVWYDTEETVSPNFKYNSLADIAGTVGVGSDGVNGNVAGVGWHASYDDIIVTPLFTIDPSPDFVYANSGTTTLTFTSSQLLNDLQATATGPDNNTPWTLNNATLAGCSGNYSCTAEFPTDFSGASITTLGTYKITATNGDDSSYTLIESREQPVLSFVVANDLHTGYAGTTSDLTYLSELVSAINSQSDFPTPNFVVLPGDLVDGTEMNGVLATQLANLKPVLDGLSNNAVPYYVITGNHDTINEVGANMGLQWIATFGSDRFSYSWTSGNYLFIAMDVEVATENNGGLGTTLNSADHKAWLTAILDANAALATPKKVFLFSHYGFRAVRDVDSMYLYPDSASGEMRDILRTHGAGYVLAQFSGHAHLNGLASLDNINYFRTASFKQNDEYRYVEVYSDRVETHIGKKSLYRLDGNGPYYTTNTDSTHPTIYSYNRGLPTERQSEFNYATDATKTPTIEDGISVATDSSAWKDYTYQTNITLGHEDTLGENVAGIVFRYTDANNYYSVILDSAADTIKLQKKENGVVSTLSSADTTIDLNTDYTLKVTAKGISIKVYLGSDLKIDTTDATFSAGKIGLRTYRASTQYDNVSVIDLGNPNSFTLSSPSNGSSVASYSPTFTWNAATDNESVIDYYQLYVDGSLNKNNIASTSATPTGTLSYGDHTWYVKAVDNAGNSTSSSTFNLNITDITAPTGLSLSLGTVTDSSITATASGATDASPGLHATPYYFDRNSGTANSGWQAGTSWADSGLSGNTLYTYKAKVRDATTIPNESSFTDTSSKYTLAPTPTDLSADTVGQTAITLSVDSINNPTADSSGYYFANTTNSTNSGWIQTDSWQNTGLTCGTSYNYTVKYRNADGTETSTIAIDQAASACAVDADDLEISDVEYSSTENSITVKWKTNNDADSKVEYGKDTGMNNDKKNNDNENNHKIIIKNLDPDTRYYFKVKSTDENGSQDSSDRKSIHTEKASAASVFTSSLINLLGNNAEKENSGNQEEKNIIDKIGEIPEKIQEKLEEIKFFNTKVFKTGDQKYLEEVKFIIVNKSGNPIVNIPVTLHSDPQTATTDDQGIVAFQNVPTGSHTLDFSYQNEEFSKKIAIAEPTAESGAIKAEIITIKAEKDSIPVWIWGLIAGLLALLILTWIFKLKAKRVK